LDLLFLPGKRTDLYPATYRKVSLLDHDIFDRVQKWRMFSAKWELDIEDYFGKRILYAGIIYKGTPELVFWHYFPPFFQFEIPRLLNDVYSDCNNRKLEPDVYVKEAAELLKVMVRRLWKEIARTHQLLKGNGFPKEKDLTDVSGTIDSTNQNIDREVRAILLHGPSQETASKEVPEDIIDIKPNFMGLGINLNAAWRWIKAKFIKM
jgi:hypothetical protein